MRPGQALGPGLRAAAALSARAAAVGIGVVVLVQVLLRFAAGDAADLVTADPALRARLVEAWGLDAPLPTAVARTLALQWGESLTLRPGQAVLDLVAERAPASAQLGASGLLLTILLGALPGPARAVGALGAAPLFLLGFAAMTGLNELAWWGQGWWGRPAWFALPDTPSPLRDLLTVLILVVGAGNLAGARRELHAARRALDAAPHMEAARVRGQPLGPVRAAGLLPAVAEVASRRLVGIVGGIVVVERVFSQPGLGDLLWQAVVLRDVPVALGSALTLALGATAARWALDLLRLWAEPRLWGPA